MNKKTLIQLEEDLHFEDFDEYFSNEDNLDKYYNTPLSSLIVEYIEARSALQEEIKQLFEDNDIDNDLIL